MSQGRVTKRFVHKKQKVGEDNLKIFHLSDLHIGKQLHYYNLKENQRAILQQIIDKAEEYRPDAILICGDIFDKSVPSAEAYTIFDEFLNKLADVKPQIPVLIIAGNHDNPHRLAYAGEFLEKHGIYVSVLPPQKEEEHIRKVELEDAWGKVNFYLLPFLKPGHVRHLFAEGTVTDYNSAIRELLCRDGIDKEQINQEERNVLLSHQFYVNGKEQPMACDSEQWTAQVGGLDSIEASVAEHFDYVALGHIHGAQKVKSPHIRYCGTPLKYSVSEEKHEKSITLVTLEEKGKEPLIETIPLLPMQEVRTEKGLLADILARATEENCHDFISVTITDEKEPYHPMEQLEEKYDCILELRVDNQRTRSIAELPETGEFQMNPLEVFQSFYQDMHGQSMSEEEEVWLKHILGETDNDSEGEQIEEKQM